VVWRLNKRRLKCLACFNQRGHTLLQKTTPIARERDGSWIYLVFNVGRLFRDHIFILIFYFGGIINHTHYSSIYIPDCLYYCMRSVIYLNKTRIWGICGYFLCYFSCILLCICILYISIIYLLQTIQNHYHKPQCNSRWPNMQIVWPNTTTKTYKI